MADSPRFNQALFLEWKAHPLTAPFLQFLRDQQETLGKRWMAGDSVSPQDQTKAQLMGELSTLEWADVASFYEIEITADEAS
jgi:hypothetical protein